MNESQVSVYVKSRRIGISWVDALKSVLKAANGNANTFYISYNKDMTEQYIEDCAFWANFIQCFAGSIEKEIIDVEGKDELVFRIRFRNGKKIVALSSKASSLRSIQGDVVIDEAAFCQDLGQLIKAASAMKIWGNNIRIISTHNGIDNPFNELINKIKSGELNYSLHETPINQAIADGLYKRICFVSGVEWSEQGEVKWLADLVAEYGIGADEELFCIPMDTRGGGKVFNKAWFENKIIDYVPSYLRPVRFWDLAATARELKEDAFYTAGNLMATNSGKFYILDVRAEQLSPTDGDDWMIKTAQEDGYKVNVRWELEGGSAGLKYESSMKQQLLGFNAKGTRPLGDKLTRAKPFANECFRGNVYLVRDNWNIQRYIDNIHLFDGYKSLPLVNDYVDCSSGAYHELTEGSVNNMIFT